MLILNLWQGFLRLSAKLGLRGPWEWAAFLVTSGVIGLVIWFKVASYETSSQRPLPERKARVVGLFSETNDRQVWTGRGIDGITYFFHADASDRLAPGDQVCIRNAGRSNWSLTREIAPRSGNSQRPQSKPCHGLPDVPVLD